MGEYMDNKRFIITNCEETATLLLNSKYNLIGKNGNQWIFLNEPQKMVFGTLRNLTYTNILSI